MPIAYTLAGQYGAAELLSSTGAILPNHSVTVYLHGTLTLATLYTDNTKGTTTPNPTTTDPAGNLLIFTEPKRVDLTPLGESTVSEVVPPDPNDPVLGVTPALGFQDKGGQVFNVKAYGAKGDGTTDDSAAFVLAAAAVSATGGVLLVPPGTYVLNTFQANSYGLPFAFAIGSNVTVFLDGATLTSTVTLTAFNCIITNTARNTVGNVNVKVIGGAITCIAPVMGSTGMTWWQVPIEFHGVSQGQVANCTMTNGGVTFFPLVSVFNTSTALSAGANTHNTIENCTFINQTASTSFFQGTYSTILNCNWSASNDDAVLIGSAGIGHKIIGCNIDMTPVFSGKGGTNGGVYLNNDGGVSWADTAMDDILIQSCTIVNSKGYNNGPQAGVGTNSNCRNVRIDNCTLAANTVGFSQVTSGATSDGLQITNCSIHHNQQCGIQIDSWATSSSKASLTNVLIEGNDVFDNSQVGSGTYAGIRFYGYGQTGGYTGIMTGKILNNAVHDDQATPTQLQWLYLYQDTTLTWGTLGFDVFNNDLVNPTGGTGFGSSNFGIGGNNRQCIVRGNFGYNPVGVVTPSVPATTVAVAAVTYDRTFYITTTAEVSVTIQTGPTIVLGTSLGVTPVRVPAGKTLTPTYSSTAPTWVVEGE